MERCPKIEWKQVILWDHLVDQIEQSNRRLECPNLEQPHRYTKAFQIQHYKIGRMLWFVWFAFAFPES